MGILLGLAPFIAFLALLRLVSPMAGLGAALVVSLMLCIRMWRRGDTVKILEIGSLCLFAALVLVTVVAAPDWTIATVRLAVDGGLLAVILVSLLIGRPFTLQYARERVSPEYWRTPRFIRTNTLITVVWAGAFAVLVLSDAAAEYVPAVPVGVDIAASIAALGAAIGFSLWYPTVARRAAPAAEVGSTQR